MKHNFKTKGVCAKQIQFTLDENNILTELEFIGGCAGNTAGVATLAVGKSASELSEMLRGIKCGLKDTSCPAQLSIALAEAISSK